MSTADLRDKAAAAASHLQHAHRLLDEITQAIDKAEQCAPPAWLDYTAAAEYLGMTKAALYKAVQSGRVVPSGRNGRYVRFRREDLDTFLAGGK